MRRIIIMALAASLGLACGAQARAHKPHRQATAASHASHGGGKSSLDVPGDMKLTLDAGTAPGRRAKSASALSYDGAGTGRRGTPALVDPGATTRLN